MRHTSSTIPQVPHAGDLGDSMARKRRDDMDDRRMQLEESRLKMDAWSRFCTARHEDDVDTMIMLCDLFPSFSKFLVGPNSVGTGNLSNTPNPSRLSSTPEVQEIVSVSVTRLGETP